MSRKPGYTAYPYPHPYRNYYYTFLDTFLNEISKPEITIAGNTSISLKWNDVLGEDGYNIYISTNGNSYTKIDSTGLNVISKTINNLYEGTTYYFYIKAYNDTHEGKESEVLVTSTVKGLSPLPVYISSSVENAAPSLLEMTFSLNLANIVPAISAFNVMVNSVARSINSVIISGTKVLLALSSPIVNGDIITVAYTIPSANPLQTSTGGKAATISAQRVANNVSPGIPVYQSSSIENATPSLLTINYSLNLTNIVPAISAFNVMVNSVARSINSVTISGTKVLLALSSPIVNGDIITVAYTIPSANPLQTSTGGKAATISAQSVTNNVSPGIPVYQSSSIENATPSLLTINYSLNLTNIVPAISAFNVMVNSVARSINSVTISGTKVLLSLSSPILSGDIVTVAYTKPSYNSLQTISGGQAASFDAQPVTNNIVVFNTAPVVMVNYKSSSYSGFVNEISAGGSYDTNKDNLTYSWIVPKNVPVSSTTSSTIKYLSPIVSSTMEVNFTLSVSDGKATSSEVIPIEILPYEPELDVAEISNIEASSFQVPYYPYNVIDGNIGTMWSANGENQWLIIELKKSFSVQHVKLAFQPGKIRESYFDILGSVDKIEWDPILNKSASCAFSGDLQVFEFPSAKSAKEFNYIKLIGRCNSTDTWNYISELKIFGYFHRNSPEYEKLPVKIFPNPAKDYLNIRIDDPALNTDFIKISDLSGKVLFSTEVDPDIREFKIPLNLKRGIYLLQMGVGKLIQFTQKLVVSD